MAKLTKNRKESLTKFETEKLYSLKEASDVVKNFSKLKFDSSIDLAVNLGVDPKKADQNVRGIVSLPNGTGKDVKVLALVTPEKEEEAKKAGADFVGSEDLMIEIQNGKSDFDRVIATPDMMGLVGRLGKVLGPRGLMPNPKLGTVTNDVGDAVKAAKAGQVEFRTEKAGIVHGGIGKASFSDEQLTENATAFVTAIQKARPTGAKGTFIKRIAVSSSQGPGVRVDTTGLGGDITA